RPSDLVAVRRIGGGASGLHGASRLFPTLGACQGDRPLAVALRLRRYAARSLGLFSELGSACHACLCLQRRLRRLDACESCLAPMDLGRDVGLGDTIAQARVIDLVLLLTACEQGLDLRSQPLLLLHHAARSEEHTSELQSREISY